MTEPLPEIDIENLSADEAFALAQATVIEAEPPPEPVRQPTRGERLVGITFNPSGDHVVTMTKARSAMVIDDLSNLPLLMVERNGNQTYDPDHLKIVEEAIARQVDATMWAVKALTWGR